MYAFESPFPPIGIHSPLALSISPLRRNLHGTDVFCMFDSCECLLESTHLARRLLFSKNRSNSVFSDSQTTQAGTFDLKHSQTTNIHQTHVQLYV